LYKTEHPHLKSFIRGGVKMRKLLMVAAVVFIVVMIAPELRAMMLVSGVSVMIGMMIGMQHKTKHDTELSYNRLLRNVGNSQPVYSGDGEQWQS
jgi:hypothetical protein